MNSKPFSEAELESLARLRAMDDADIDLSDIPEMTAEQWNDPRRPEHFKRSAQVVTLEIAGPLARWLQEHGTGQPLDVEIRRALHHYVRDQQRRAG